MTTHTITELVTKYNTPLEQNADVDIADITTGARYRKDMGDIAGLADSIKRLGLLQPIVVTNDNQLVAGGRRIEAFKSLGWTRIPVRRVNIARVVDGEHDENEIRKEFTVSERVAIGEALKAELGERRGRPGELAANAANSGKTADIVAAKVGFGSGDTLARAVKVATHGVPDLIRRVDDGSISISAAATLASQPPEVQMAALAANDNKQTRLGNFSGDNEWYTPATYIELAREVMGTIDLDPASNDIAQANVKAGMYYTLATNGLDKPWHGNVWLNPPYSTKEIQEFAAKVVAEHAAGNMSQAIVLTNNSGDTSWHHSLCAAAACWCITRGRIKFESPTRESGAGAMGQVFFYFGPNRQKFKDVFSAVGRVDIAL